ncbi:MAG TPA: MATE family efflux transporter [Tissierellia bacterium]|nr:MATE family efflux transporter [Tissierellia bacterium]
MPRKEINPDHEQQQYTKMTGTPIPKLVFLLSLPSIVSMIITSIYNTADAYFVSQISTAASGAVGIVLPMMALTQGIGFTYAVGAGTQVAQLLGARKVEEANQYGSSAMAIAIISGILITLFGQWQLDNLLRLFGATETILPYAKDYARWILFGAPISISQFVLNLQLRFQGKNNLSMVGLMIGGILNIILDPIFIFTFGLGIKGAAMATILSQMVSWAILYWMVRNKSILEISLRNISSRIQTYATIVGTGISSFLRQGLASIAIILLNNAARPFGDEAIAAIVIVGRVSMIMFSVIIGIGQGFQPIAGYNYGAKMYSRVREAWRVTYIAMTVLVSITGAIIFINSPSIIRAFRSDAMVVSIGSTMLRYISLSLIAQPMLTSTNMLLQTTGHIKASSFLAATRQGLFFIPLLLVLPPLFGIRGIQISQPIADVLSAIAAIPFLIYFMKNLPKVDGAEK